MKAPVVTVVTDAAALLELADVAEVDALPVLEPLVPLARLLVAEAVMEDDIPVAASASAVAFRVPHFSLFLHVD